MPVGQSKNNQKGSRVLRRTLSLEALSSRVVLSAGGLGDGGADVDLQELSIVGTAIERTHDAGVARLEFGTPTLANTPGAWPMTSPTNWPSNASWYGLEPSTGYAEVNQIFATRVAAQGAGAYGINLGALQNVTLSFMANVSMFPSLQFGALSALNTFDFAPQIRGNSIGSTEFHRPGAPYDVPAPSEPIADRPGFIPAGGLGGDGRPGGIVQDAPPRGQSTDVHSSGSWLVAAPATTVSVTTTPSEGAPASKIALVPSRLETLATDLEGGLIELESPALPRTKRPLKTGENLTDEAAESDDLRELLDMAWSGWNRMYDAYSEMNPSENFQRKSDIANDQVAAVVSEAAVQAALADAEGGMIELSAPAALPAGGVATSAGPSYLVQTPLDVGQKIRMDAGVALYHSFEIATAPDAVPPASTATTNAASTRAAAGDKSAKSKESSSEDKLTSAALVGAGLLFSAPFSIFRNRKQEEAELARRQSRLNVERID